MPTWLILLRRKSTFWGPLQLSHNHGRPDKHRSFQGQQILLVGRDVNCNNITIAVVLVNSEDIVDYTWSEVCNMAMAPIFIHNRGLSEARRVVFQFEIDTHLNSATMPKTRMPPGTNSETEGAETTPALQLQQAVTLQDQDQPHLPLIDPDRPAVRQKFAAVDNIVLLKAVNLYRHWTAPAGTSNGIMNVLNQIAVHCRLDPAFGLKNQGPEMRTRFNTLMSQFKADQCQSMRKSGTVEEDEERDACVASQYSSMRSLISASWKYNISL
ncbi:unnamed protein product [Phytophthora fragariaefolia]|uniref:Unnamed protein product n=1 Tax=Phytophthora fragariaefolia TaxID=1490495 RepID=A0A9W7D5Z6_9STRA|nr:unnamed protein product [Phytophthora fragariaefolia]